MQVYDIAIVGGGLGGLTLAVQAAQAGYKVVLFEKEQYPFHKVCGEYISMESWDFLHRCGIDLSAMSLPQINKLSISDTKGNLFSFPLSLGGFGISRYTLDALLAGKATALGVELRTGEKVVGIRYEESLGYEEEGLKDKEKDKAQKDGSHIVETNKASIIAKVVVGTFGKRSNIDLKLQRKFVGHKPSKINNYIGVKYHILYNNEPNTIALHNFNNGYCGISSIEDGKSCLCYLTTADNVVRSRNSIQQMEKEVLCDNPHLKNIFSNAEFLYDQPVTISQISFDKKEQVVDHILMVGDTAGLITPLCGNGMSMAMEAGVLAMTMIDAYLNGRITRLEMEQGYSSAWQSSFAFRTAIGRQVQTYFGGASIGFFLRVMQTIPPLAQWLIKQTHGKGF